jgi:hypothetical protein
MLSYKVSSFAKDLAQAYHTPPMGHELLIGLERSEKSRLPR